MKAIKVIIVYVALPFLMIGLIFGAIIISKFSSNRLVEYTVIQKCEGEECVSYKQFITSLNEMCHNVLNKGNIVYINDTCEDIANSTYCLQNQTYIYCTLAINKLEEDKKVAAKAMQMAFDEKELAELVFNDIKSENKRLNEKIMELMPYLNDNVTVTVFYETIGNETYIVDIGIPHPQLNQNLNITGNNTWIGNTTWLTNASGISINESILRPINSSTRKEIIHYKELNETYIPEMCAVCAEDYVDGEAVNETDELYYNCKEDFWHPDYEIEDERCVPCTKNNGSMRLCESGAYYG